eukprot:XP_014775277.1 PREDICTED: uncharacterized protein LOC106872713 isoform X1 [Octopus bimaculoides]
MNVGYDVQRDMWWLNRSRFRFRLPLSTDLENKNTKETKPPSHLKAATVSNRPTKKVTQGKRPSSVGKLGKPPSMNVKLEKGPSNSLKQEKCSSCKTTSESSSASRMIKHRVSSSTSVTENLPPETLNFEKRTPKAITFGNCTQKSSIFAKHKEKLFGNRHRKSVALENCVPRTVTLDKTPEHSRKRVTFAERPPTRITFSDISNNHRKQFSFSSLFSKLKRHGVK